METVIIVLVTLGVLKVAKYLKKPFTRGLFRTFDSVQNTAHWTKHNYNEFKKDLKEEIRKHETERAKEDAQNM